MAGGSERTAAAHDPEDLAGLDARHRERFRAGPHPSARLTGFDTPAARLWMAMRPPQSFALAALPDGLPALVVRSGVASIFFLLGRTKVDGPLHVRDSA